MRSLIVSGVSIKACRNTQPPKALVSYVLLFFDIKHNTFILFSLKMTLRWPAITAESPWCPIHFN